VSSNSPFQLNIRGCSCNLGPNILTKDQCAAKQYLISSSSTARRNQKPYLEIRILGRPRHRNHRLYRQQRPTCLLRNANPVTRLRRPVSQLLQLLPPPGLSPNVRRDGHAWLLRHYIHIPLRQVLGRRLRCAYEVLEEMGSACSLRKCYYFYSAQRPYHRRVLQRPE
jgi:hypothetical protein